VAEPCRFFVGNQTAFWAPIDDPFGFAVEHRFEAFELFPDGGPSGRGWSARDVSAEHRLRLREIAREHDVRLSVHAALEAHLLDQSRWASLERDIELARDLGARVLNVHIDPGDAPGCADAVRFLMETLRPAGITLALENTVTVGPDYVNQLFERLHSASESSDVGLCLDIGHANLYAKTRNDYLGYLDQLDDHVPIVHAHIHENWGDADRHLTLFTGPSAKDPSGAAGLMRRLRRRGFCGSLILEQWPTPASLLLTARDRLRAMGTDSP
jgi:sugar phosphate isomerase/epimerase